MALRRRARLRQADVGAAADVSQSTVARIEAGRLGAHRVDTIRRVVGALDARLEVSIQWRGGEIDRLVDEQHAVLVQAVAAWFAEVGWSATPEVSYSIFGERGSIDVLALDPVRPAALVVEVKSRLTSIEATLRKHDEKVRLAPRICEDRLGRRPTAVGRVLVLPESARRTFGRAPVLRDAYAGDRDELRRWLREPHGPIAAAWFSADTHRRNAGRRSARVGSHR